MTSTISLFVFGLGNSAGAFARAMLAKGAKVSGTVREAEKAAALRAEELPRSSSTACRLRKTSLPRSARQRISCSRYLLARVAIRHFASTRKISSPPKISNGSAISPPSASMAIMAAPGSASARRRIRAPAARRIASRPRKPGAHLLEKRGVPLAHPPPRRHLWSGQQSAEELSPKAKARRIVKQDQVFNRIHVDDIVADSLRAALQKKKPTEFSMSATTSRRRRRTSSNMLRH